MAGDFYLSFVEVLEGDDSGASPGAYVHAPGLLAMLELLETEACPDPQVGPHVGAHIRELREGISRGIVRARESMERRRRG